MSHELQDALVRHMKTMQRVRHITHKGNTTLLNGEGYRLMHFVAYTAGTDRLFFTSQEQTAEETGISKTNVSFYLKLFVAEGWLKVEDIEKIGKYKTKGNCYRVVFDLKVSQLTTHENESGHESDRQPEQKSPSKSEGKSGGESHNSSKPSELNKTASNPNPKQNQNPNPNPSATTSAGLEPDSLRAREEEIFELIFDREPKDNDRGNLRAFLRTKYEPIIARALTEHPEQRNDFIVDFCLAVRYGKPTPTPRFKQCPACFGKGATNKKHFGQNFQVACYKCKPKEHETEVNNLPTEVSTEGLETFRAMRNGRKL